MATQDLIKVLYTHQKTKKCKTWQDGFVKVDKDKKVVLLDENKAFVSSFSCPASKLVAGEEIDTARHLITIDEVETAQAPPAKKPCSVRPRGPPLSRPKHSYSVPARSDWPAPAAAASPDTIRPAAVHAATAAAAATQRTLPRQLLAMAKSPDDAPGAGSGDHQPVRRRVAEVPGAGQSERCNYSAGLVASQQPDKVHASVHCSSFAGGELDQGRGAKATRELPDRGRSAPSASLYRPGECRSHESSEDVADHTTRHGGRAGYIQELEPPASTVTNLSASRPEEDHPEEDHPKEDHPASVLPSRCKTPISRSADEIIALIRGTGTGQSALNAASLALT